MPDPRTLWAGKGITMEQDKEKLIEEIGDLALKYDKNYFG
jgi:hypothetical protein